MFVRNNNKKALYYSAHGIILKLNPGINLIENPLFTKKELKQFFRDEISFIEEAPKAPKTEAPKTEETKVEAPKTEETKVEAPKTEAPKTEAPKTEETKVEETKVELKAPVEAKKSTKGAGKKGFSKGSRKNK